MELLSKSLSDCAIFISGGTPPKSNNSLWSGELPWVSSGEMAQPKIFDTALHITYQAGKEHSKIVPKQTILVVVRGMSLANEFRVALTQREMAFNQDIKALIPREGINPLFLFYSLYGRRFEIKKLASESAHGTKKLDTKVLESLPVILPSLPVQEKIAAILSAYDDLIENNRRRIALLEKMAEEIYREWFVRLRFPGCEQAMFDKGVPEGWKLIKIAKAFEITGGGTPSKEEARYWKDGNINWYTPSDITAANGIFLSSSGLQCTEDGLNSSSARLFPAYSIMMTSRATIGAIGINTTPACTNQGFITCIPNKNYPLFFLYYWLKLNITTFELLSSGATFSELSKSTFKNINILTPKIELIYKFNANIAPMFKKIELLLSEVTILKQIRDRLLTRLISDKLSVDDLDIQFPSSMPEERLS